MSEKKQFYNDPSINLVPPTRWNDAKSLVQKLAVVISKALDIDVNKLELEHPKDSIHGDFSINIALKMAKVEKRKPMDIATDYVEILKKDETLTSFINKIEALHPGFINFYLKPEFIFNEVQKLNDLENVGYKNILKNKRISFEFAHPNPFKSFHIGHLRNIILGESLVRMLEEVGAEVIRVNYQGDVGMHIAKSIWGILTLEKQGDTVKKQESLTPSQKTKYLGKAYALGASAFEDSDKAKQEIKAINAQIYVAAQKKEEKRLDTKLTTNYQKFVPEDASVELDIIDKLWHLGREWSIEYLHEEIYKRLYSHFDREYMESETMKFSEDALAQCKKDGVLKESEGALIFDGKEYGLDTRVFENSLGLPTYEGKELGLAPMEFNDHGTIDLSIHNVAVEQISFFKVTIKAKELLDPETYKGKMYHNAYEFVGLKSGKMSSRTGQVVLAEDILNDARERIDLRLRERDGFSNEEKSDIAEKIAIGAIKYSFLNLSPFSYMAFDLEASLNFEGNSGPYLQYTYARSTKILNDAKKKGIIIPKDLAAHDFTKEEITLLRHLINYEEAIIDATKTLSPNILATYTFELAQKFNLFYKANGILKESDENIRANRLFLTSLTQTLIEKNLYLLGIKVVEKM